VLKDGFQSNQVVCDIGGGARPWISPEEKQRLNLKVVGVDISEEELRAAPAGAYDKIIATDICEFIGDASFDVVTCQALLEHVPDTKRALRAIASALKPNGLAYVFIPCRNALFAQINRLIPQDAKRRMLFFLWPYAAEGHDGFHAYYDGCSPSTVEAVAKGLGLEAKDKQAFWAAATFISSFPPIFCGGCIS